MKKLNRNGFTLIELLAVIVILGILLMTAIPAVTKNIAKSRRNTYWQNAKSYVKAATTPYLAGEYYKKDTADVCPLPGAKQYVSIPLTEVELEQGDKTKSSFNSPYITDTNNKCRPMIVVVNKAAAEGDPDNLQWYFIGMDKAGNGINSLTNINDLKLSSVVTGSKACPSDNVELTSASVTIDSVSYTHSATCKSTK